MPEIFELSEPDRLRFLRSYQSIYLKEEVIAEQIVRKVQPFRNFLELIGIHNVDQGNRKRLAFEIKSGDRVDELEVREFQRLAADIPGAGLLLLSNDPQPQRYDQVECLHWRAGLEKVLSLS